MEKLQNQLIGALVGLARATDGNEHFITPELTGLITEGLTACQPDSGTDEKALETLLKRAVAAKKEMVPNCFLCDNPCGRTSDFNLAELYSAPVEVQEYKKRMLQLAQSAAADANLESPSLLYDALYLFGLEMNTTEYLMPTIERLENCLK